ncbi:MAG: Txe/YoeB family addiction module toxin [Pyramidobacter sp.]|nr:Txe/YoeB family addiction module toxin [Pyramidobacter sp.]
MKKINRLIKELLRSGNPACGEGSPEPLKGDLSGWWSKRINEKYRLVYAIEDGRLVIAQCGSHYGDK